MDKVIIDFVLFELDCFLMFLIGMYSYLSLGKNDKKM